MHHANEPTSATIRAFSSLTRRDADAVRATLRAASCSYTVQEHDDYDGYLSVLLTPADDTRPSYMVAGRTGAVDLAELHGDDMAALGTFPSIGSAMAVLRPMLERNQPGSIAPTATATAATLREQHGADASLHAAMRADATPGRPGWSAVLRTLDDLGAA
jgi:hypothetical protein